jgi:type III pantothenate kinase
LKQLAIDIGNTRLKLGLFEGEHLLQTAVLNHQDEPDEHWLHAAEQVIVSTVSGFIPAWLKTKRFQNVIFLTHETQVPVKIGYKTPETLGMDRLAAVCGAYSLYPNKNVLITDAGSCITYDFLSAEGWYEGGMISPGIHMRLKAMQHYTGGLPLLHFEDLDPVVGTDTRSSMLLGVKQGVLGEFLYIRQILEQQYKDLTSVLTGGDHDFFEKHIKNRIFANPNLVLTGLNHILLFNVR